MAIDIITQYSGPFTRRSPESKSGDGESCRVIVKDYDAGTETIIFTGKEFSEEEFKMRCNERKRK